MDWKYFLLGALIVIGIVYFFRDRIFKRKQEVIEKFEEDNKCVEKFEPKKEVTNKAFLEFSMFKDEKDRDTEIPIGRVEILLYDDVVPKTCENFKSLCRVEYKNSVVHRLIKGFMVQMGDYENGNGTGGKSIYGEKFDDENFIKTHNKRGILSMANSGANTNGSQFFITFDKTPHLDNKHVVFGEVVEGFDVLDMLEAMKTNEHDEPEKLVIISKSGIV
jgi:cyclophilin family peptidyl-prolyl cis-trans isomerase